MPRSVTKGNVLPHHRLKAIRVVLGVTQKQFAAMLGLPESSGERHVAMWESGDLKPRQIYINMGELLYRLDTVEKIVGRAVANDINAIMTVLDLD